MKVSIVTPSYNQGKFLHRTLQSVAIQSDADIEHIIFDGGSTDESIDILNRFDGKITWTTEKDQGQADAVNKAIRAARGEIIGWLNSDDIFYPGAIEKVVAAFKAYPDVDVVYGMADHIDVQDNAFEAYPTEAFNFERLRDRCFICQPALFFRRGVFEEHGALNTDLHYCMDYEYWLRLAKAGIRFHYLETKLAGSRLYSENKTLGSRVRVHAEINDMQRALFGRVPDRWLWNYTHAVVERKLDAAKQPRRFALWMLIVVTKAAYRWNGGISPVMKVHICDLWSRFRNRTG